MSAGACCLAGLAVLVAGVVPAHAQEPLDSYLVGRWGLDDPMACDSGNILVLEADRTAMFGAGSEGRWVLRDGAVMLYLIESEMGGDAFGTRTVEMRLAKTAPDQLVAEFADGADTWTATAFRCSAVDAGEFDAEATTSEAGVPLPPHRPEDLAEQALADERDEHGAPTCRNRRYVEAMVAAVTEAGYGDPALIAGLQNLRPASIAEMSGGDFGVAMGLAAFRGQVTFCQALVRGQRMTVGFFTEGRGLAEMSGVVGGISDFFGPGADFLVAPEYLR